MDWYGITGWIGAALVLAAFYVSVVRNWPPHSGKYLVLSNTAAVLLIINACMNAAYPFVVVNVALILVTLYTIGKKGWPKWHGPPQRTPIGKPLPDPTLRE